MRLAGTDLRPRGRATLDERLKTLVEAMVAPVPTPEGMTSREIVRRAIELDRPPRVPYSFQPPFGSDFFEPIALAVIAGPRSNRSRTAARGELRRDEWGIGWDVTGRHWDHAVDHPLSDLGRLDHYRFPDVAAAERFDWLAPHLEQARAAGKYVVGWDPIGM